MCALVCLCVCVWGRRGGRKHILWGWKAQSWVTSWKTNSTVDMHAWPCVCLCVIYELNCLCVYIYECMSMKSRSTYANATCSVWRSRFANLCRQSWCRQEIALPRGETSTSPACQNSIERFPLSLHANYFADMMDDRLRHSRPTVGAFLHNMTDIRAVYCEIWCQNCFINAKRHFESYFIIFFPPLAEPYFVQAVDYGDFIYFFFREIAMEYNTMGKVCTGPIVLLLFEVWSEVTSYLLGELGSAWRN